MTYREAAPSEDFAHLVFSFWEFATADKDFGSIQHEIFPDGCLSLFYQRNEKFNLRRIAFSGLDLESVTVPVFPGETFWAMRISPAACTYILGENPAILRAEKLIEAERFLHLTNGLLEKLNLCESFEEAIAVFENHLKNLNFGRDFCDEKIAKLAADMNLSTRQFERRFKGVSGLSPKQFARARRLRATAVALVENGTINWANRAAEMGFTDQSHLAHEFVSVTKRSPNSFAEKVKQIDHGKLIK
jgi:AraC-like DNA-binding protein